MELWLALIIPIIFAIIALIKFRKQIAFWEPFIPVLATLVLILIFKVIGYYSLTSDNEYWGNNVTEVRYYEDWNEWIERTCSEQYACGTDSKGNTQYCTRYYDCSYCQYHSAYYTMVLNDGDEMTISKSYFDYLTKRFNRPAVFVDMHRDYHTHDGDMYETEWGGDDASLEFIASEHTYENKVQCSDDVFNYPEVSEEDVKTYKLFDYPEIDDNYKLNAIIADSGLTYNQAWIHDFDVINGKLGMGKQVRVWIVLMKNSLRERANMQEWYWKGGNKNELIYVINLDDRKYVKWCKVISWTEREDLKVETRSWVEVNFKNKPLDLKEFAQYLTPQIASKWQRKHFEDFDYISVDTPTWSIWCTWILSVLACAGIYFWLITNEYTDENQPLSKISDIFKRRRY